MAHGFRGATTNRIGAIAGQRRGRRIGSIAGAYRGRRMGAIAGNEALEGDGLDEQSQRHADYAEMDSPRRGPPNGATSSARLPAPRRPSLRNHGDSGSRCGRAESSHGRWPHEAGSTATQAARPAPPLARCARRTPTGLFIIKTKQRDTALVQLRPTRPSAGPSLLRPHLAAPLGQPQRC